MLFTVELKDAGTKDPEVEIYCDSAGLDYLLNCLAKLKLDTTGTSHVHFMTSEWAGNELSSVAQGDGNQLVNHLVVSLKKLNA